MTTCRGMRYFYFPLPPMLSWVLVPLDGIVSNPPALCASVSISCVARGPLYSPRTQAALPTLSIEEIRLMLYWWGIQHFLFIERQSSMKKCLKAGHQITWPHLPFYQIKVDPNNFTNHSCVSGTKKRTSSCFFNPSTKSMTTSKHS